MACVLVDSAHFPSAVDYYRNINTEPIRSAGVFTITNSFSVAPFQFDQLLNQIATQSNPEVLIVSHGGIFGLQIPLVRGGIGLLPGVIEPLYEYSLGVSSGDETAGICKLAKADLESITSAVLKVQGLKLQKLILRACSVGGILVYLEGLARLFNAAFVCAPTILDLYAQIDPRPICSTAAIFNDWVKRHPSATVELTAPDRFAWSLSFPSGLTRPHFDVAAESILGVSKWLTLHFPKPLRVYSGGVFQIHTLYNDKLKKIVFPNDSEFKDNLASYPV
jgi:hypothetical protein